MAKTFHFPFETYSLNQTNPIDLELSRQPAGYLTERLSANPLYYENAVQFIGGGLLRASLGYEAVWSREWEEKFSGYLDFYLSRCERMGSYFFETIEVLRGDVFWGQKWKGGLRPKKLFGKPDAFKIAKGERLFVRINRAEITHWRADLEMNDGTVFSMPSHRYFKLRRFKFFKLIESSQKWKGWKNVKRARYLKSQQREGSIMAKRPLADEPA